MFKLVKRAGLMINAYDNTKRVYSFFNEKKQNAPTTESAENVPNTEVGAENTTRVTQTVEDDQNTNQPRC